MSQFFIADTFTASLAKVTRDAQKRVTTTAFNLQTGAPRGMSFHTLTKASDKHSRPTSFARHPSTTWGFLAENEQCGGSRRTVWSQSRRL